MAWFKVDDSFTDHPKVKSIPRAERRAAIGLWTLAGSYAARQLTNGFIFKHDVADLGGTARDVAALVRSGLWHEQGHQCEDCTAVALDQYLFHDWMKYQRSRDQVLSEREKASERQKRARERAASGSSQRDETVTHAVTNGVSHGDVTALVTVPPTRPDPTVRTEVGLEEGERRETLRAVPATEPECSRHPLADSVAPCTGCARVRAWRDKNETKAQREAEQERQNCAMCEGTGFVLDADKNPTGKCVTHRRRA